MSYNEYDGQKTPQTENATLENTILQYFQRYLQDKHSNPDYELRGAIGSIGLALEHLSRDRYNVGKCLLMKLLTSCKEELEVELHRREVVARRCQAM